MMIFGSIKLQQMSWETKDVSVNALYVSTN